MRSAQQNVRLEGVESLRRLDTRNKYLRALREGAPYHNSVYVERDQRLEQGLPQRVLQSPEGHESGRVQQDRMEEELVLGGLGQVMQEQLRDRPLTGAGHPARRGHEGTVLNSQPSREAIHFIQVIGIGPTQTGPGVRKCGIDYCGLHGALHVGGPGVRRVVPPQHDRTNR